MFKYSALHLAVILLSFACSSAKNIYVNDNSFHNNDLAIKNGVEKPNYVKAGNPVGGNHLTVHIMSHTHDDVGWLKTVEEYYIGANQSIQYAGVQYILDTVVEALERNPEYKFIYVEIAYFQRWWEEQTEQKKESVRGLVKKNSSNKNPLLKIHYFPEGWCMNDEGATTYEAVVDQMTLGHEFLYENFGVRPTIGWHIDPFGHASTQASLFSQMGFNAFFFARIDYEDYANRKSIKNLETVWRPSRSLGTEVDMFSHMLYDMTYCPPIAFEWEYGGPPIQDNPKMFDVNVKERCDLFAEDVRNRSKVYRTDQIMWAFGCDFQYMNSVMEFKNMDKIIKYINARPEIYNMTLKYSTPSIYIEAVHKKDLTWSVKTDDFFPYADRPYAYWTGYFTSRSALKNYIRTRNALLHITEKMLSTISSKTNEDHLDSLHVLRDAMGVAQHHDAITGTERQAVADDYALRLNIGTLAVEKVINQVLGNQINPATPPEFKFCHYLNVSYCPPMSENLKVSKSVPIVLYNPVGWERKHWVRAPVPSQSFEVVNGQGIIQASQIYDCNDPESSNFTIAFETDIPAMGFSTYIVRPLKGPAKKPIMPQKPYADTILENEFLKVSISSETGLLKSILNKKLGKNLNIQQNLLWYNASAGYMNDLSHQASGAYIFRPNVSNPYKFGVSGQPQVKVINGPLVQEVRQVWNSWIKQVIRLYAGANYLEMEATVGPINIQDNLGKEVISRYNTNLGSKATWYSDSQGQEMQTRIRNYRPTWKVNITQPDSGNYVPINTAVYIQDEAQDLRFTILTDRSRGGASLKDGEVENMLHRRLLYDDGRGVGQALNQSDVIRTRELLFVDDISKGSSSENQRAGVLLLSNEPQYSFSNAASSQDWIQKNKVTWKGPLTTNLPKNVHIMNMRPMGDNTILFRLHHLYAVNENPVLSKPVSINLDTLFTNITITNFEELNLSANQPKAEMHRLSWKTVTDEFEPKIDSDFHTFSKRQANVITLKPMEIRTFRVTVMYF